MGQVPYSASKMLALYITCAPQAGGEAPKPPASGQLPPLPSVRAAEQKENGSTPGPGLTLGVQLLLLDFPELLPDGFFRLQLLLPSAPEILRLGKIFRASKPPLCFTMAIIASPQAVQDVFWYSPDTALSGSARPIPPVQADAGPHWA